MQKAIRHINQFSQVYISLYKELCVFALRYVHSTDLAEDLVDDVFCHILVSRPHFFQENNMELIRPYLFRSIKNKAIDFLRKNDKKSISIEDQLKDGELDAMIDSLIVNRNDVLYDYNLLMSSINMAIDSLPEKTRKIFLMSRDDAHTYKEIAEYFNISLKSVEKHVSKALKAIRKYLSEANIPFILFIICISFMNK